ncbi:hypothetical protein [Paenibacillus koleovorans]|uniref:hypothetical protein n=1 Tax=Paenibacillus koleovorans TaxID=121608 RepID=UPI000FDBE842|nr:hypothetical protein [Paenibacillus koleovorans]
MKRIQKLLFLLTSLTLLPLAGFLANPASVSACSCVAPASVAQQVKDELGRKTAIFVGKVTAVATPTRPLMRSSADPVKVNFTVSSVWKGDVKRGTAVYTAMSSASCGYDNFIVGEEYLVSAYTHEGQLKTGICEMTRPLSLATEELKLLGSGLPPIPGGDLGPKFKPSYISGALVMAAILITAAGWISIQMRRSRRK